MLLKCVPRPKTSKNGLKYSGSESKKKLSPDKKNKNDMTTDNINATIWFSVSDDIHIPIAR